jgi:flagellar motility protein MotE (MotC chaperone)
MSVANKKSVLVAVASIVAVTTAAVCYLGWGVMFGSSLPDAVHAATAEKPADKPAEKAPEKPADKPKDKGGEKPPHSTAKSETSSGAGEKLPAGVKGKDKSTGNGIVQGGLELELMREVEKRQKELDLKEEELKQKEGRISAMQADLDKQLNELKVTQSRIEDSVKQRADLDDVAVAKLAKTYSSMPPETVATLIRQMEPGIAVRVISAMKEGKAARIMAALPPDLATKLSETMIKKK